VLFSGSKKGADGVEMLDPFLIGNLAKVISCHEVYDLIVLPCGWHNKELGEDRLLGDVMVEQLVIGRVPKEKIMSFRDFDFGHKYMPPRSTEEEIILARTMIEKLGDVEVSVCIIDLFASKAIHYYEMLGIKLVGLELAHIPCDPAKNLAVTKAVVNRLIANITDPGLMDPVVAKHLESRTLAPGYFRPDPRKYIIPS
jgi:hypothetical protein